MARLVIAGCVGLKGVLPTKPTEQGADIRTGIYGNVRTAHRILKAVARGRGVLPFGMPIGNDKVASSQGEMIWRKALGSVYGISRTTDGTAVDGYSCKPQS